MKGLINLLCSLNINKADALEYAKRLKNIQIKKGEHFQMQGCSARYMGYVDSGKFRYYKIDKEGNYGAENEAYKLRVWGNEVDCFLCQRVMIDLR